MQDYQAPLRGIAKLILTLLTKLAGMFTSRINDPELRQMASGVINSAGRTVDALSDANPDDRDQLRQIINDLLSEGGFKTGAQAKILAQIQKMSNENVRIALSILANHAFPIGDLLSDAEKDNSEQMKAYLGDVLRGADGIDLFNALLSVILPPVYANTLTAIIVQALIHYLQEKGEDTGKLVQLREAEKKYSALVA